MTHTKQGKFHRSEICISNHQLCCVYEPYLFFETLDCLVRNLIEVQFTLFPAVHFNFSHLNFAKKN